MGAFAPLLDSHLPSQKTDETCSQEEEDQEPSPPPLTEAELEAQMNSHDLMIKRLGEKDTGTGIFSALHHVPEGDNELIQKQKDIEEKRLRKKRRADARARALALGQVVDNNNDEEEDEEEPKYMKGRDKLQSELEGVMTGTPFDTIDLALGSTLAQGFMDPDWRIVGKFKGLIRVMNNGKQECLFNLQQVLKPAPVKVRVYVLRGLGLAKKDFDMTGRPATSDPYLKVTDCARGHTHTRPNGCSRIGCLCTSTPTHPPNHSLSHLLSCSLSCPPHRLR